MKRIRRKKEKALAFEALEHNFDIELKCDEEEGKGIYIVWVNGQGRTYRAFAVVSDEDYFTIEKALNADRKGEKKE